MTFDNYSSRDFNLTVPVCDFWCWTEIQDPRLNEQFIETWDYAFRTFGFLILINHGLEEKYRALNVELQRFFHLPLEKKMKFRITESYGYGGYIPQGQENVSRTYLNPDKLKRPPDAVESLVLSVDNPQSFPCLKNSYETDQLKIQSVALQVELDKLTFKIMEIMAVCLKLPSHFFLEFFRERSATNDIRVAHYLLEENGEEGCLRYGEHTDYTGFTFLWRNGENGLQCLDPHCKKNSWNNFRNDDLLTLSEDDWVDIPLLQGHEDALVINAGDLIQRWTNGYWISNVHRVVGPSFRNSEKLYINSDPISVVYFTGPAGNTQINVLSESEKVASTGPILEEYKDEITADEHLWMKVNASNE